MEGKICPSCSAELEVGATKCPQCGEEIKKVKRSETAGVIEPKPQPRRKVRNLRKKIVWIGVAVLVVGFAVFAVVIYFGINSQNQKLGDYAGYYSNPAGGVIILNGDGVYEMRGYTLYGTSGGPSSIPGEKWFVSGEDKIFIPTERSGNGDVRGQYFIVKGNTLVGADKVGGQWVPGTTDTNYIYTKKGSNSTSTTP